MTGLDFNMVSYLGSAPALSDMLAGHADLMFDPMPSSAELVRSGKLRPLAVTSPTPCGTLPGVPAMCDFVPGYEAGSWFGLSAPSATPTDVVGKLNAEVNAGLADPKIKARISELGGIEIAGTPADLGRFIAAEAAKYQDVIRATITKTR